MVARITPHSISHPPRSLQATYLPVPSLPADSKFVKEFLLSLLPAQAVAAGEITWLSLDNETALEAGLENKSAMDDDGGREVWSEMHSALTYVKSFKLEGML